MKLRCLIVDDEPLARDALRSLLGRLDQVEVSGECGDAVEAFEWLHAHRTDLIFLDVSMPEMSGLDFIRSLRRPPAIILTTAYRDFAVEAFELDVVDYLVKPVGFERLLQAMEKVYQRIRGETETSVRDQGTGTDSSHLLIRVDKRTRKIPLREILFLESMKDYVQVHTRKETLVTKSTLQSLEEALPRDRFLRIHRAFLVHLSHVNAFDAETVEIAGKELPIGRSYRAGALAALHR